MSKQKDLKSVCYKNNYLTEVIARIDLVSPIPKLAEELPNNIGKNALTYFPIAERRPAFSQTIQLTSKDVSTHREEFTEWNFFGKDREKQLTIQPGAFMVVYKKYKNFKSLHDEFVFVEDEFFKHFRETQPSRLGLRYVNQVEIPNHVKWDRYINQQLLGLFSFPIKDAEPSRIFHNLEVVFDSFNLRFQFGVLNPDYPAPIRRRVFILDYDAYYSGLIEISNIRESLTDFHTAIQNLFEKSITEELRKKMNEG